MQHRYASVHSSACPTVHAHAKQLRRAAWLRSRDLQHFAQLVTRINTTICTWLSAHTIAHRNGFGPALTLCKAACGSCMCWQHLQALSVKIKHKACTLIDMYRNNFVVLGHTLLCAGLLGHMRPCPSTTRNASVTSSICRQLAPTPHTRHTTVVRAIRWHQPSYDGYSTQV